MKLLQPFHLQQMVERAEGQRILIAADFDGTLAPIVAHPDEARIPRETAETLSALSSSGKAVVAIVSGRSMSDLAERVDVPAILSGNHGMEISGEGLSFVHPDAVNRRSTVAEAMDEAAMAVSRWAGAWVEYKGLTATVHFRQVQQRDHYDLTMAVRRALSRFGPAIGLRAGKRSLEIHPRIAWNKGYAVAHIRQHLGMEAAPVLCLGDDVTDETMFRQLPGEITVCVGDRPQTAAAFSVPDTQSVGNLLGTLHDLLTGKLEESVPTAV